MNPAHKRLSRSGFLLLRTIFTIQGAHRRIADSGGHFTPAEHSFCAASSNAKPLAVIIMTRQLFILILTGFVGCQSTSNEMVRQESSSSVLIPSETKDSSICKPMTINNWVTFDTTSIKNFSESFKRKLTDELLVELCEMLKGKVSESEFEFRLNVGTPTYELGANNRTITKPDELTTSDNYVFIHADISTVFAKLYPVTIAWSSPDFSNPLDIYKADITKKKVDFFWCNDFPKEKIISDLAPTTVRTKAETGYRFDVSYYLKVFPDVTIFFDFEQKPTEESLNEIKTETEKFKDKFKTVYVHELVEYKSYYTISINHNTIDFDNYSDKDFEKDVNNLDFLLKNISDNKKIVNLRQIKFQ